MQSARPVHSPALGFLLERRVGSVYGDLKLADLEDWTTVELVALGRKIMEILAERRIKEAARAQSLATLLDGRK